MYIIWIVRLRFTSSLDALEHLMDSLTLAAYINCTISTFLYNWYLILLTPNIRHVSKCSSPNWPLITFAEHTDVWGVCQTYPSWGCHVCSALAVWCNLSFNSIILSIYIFSVSLYFSPLQKSRTEKGNVLQLCYLPSQYLQSTSYKVKKKLLEAQGLWRKCEKELLFILCN